jgi:hypothetical protein
MTVANCLDILSVADSVQLKPLKDRCIAFILANTKSVLKTPGWKNLKTENTDLVRIVSSFVGSIFAEISQIELKERKIRD